MQYTASSAATDGGVNGKPQFDPLIEVGVVGDPAGVAVKLHRQLHQRAGLRLGYPAVRAHEFPPELEQPGRCGVQEQPEHFQTVGSPQVGQRKRPYPGQLVIAALADALLEQADHLGPHGGAGELAKTPVKQGPVDGGSAPGHRHGVHPPGLLALQVVVAEIEQVGNGFPGQAPDKPAGDVGRGALRV